jgi:hypothetical protein
MVNQQMKLVGKIALSHGARCKPLREQLRASRREIRKYLIHQSCRYSHACRLQFRAKKLRSKLRQFSSTDARELQD